MADILLSPLYWLVAAVALGLLAALAGRGRRRLGWLALVLAIFSLMMMTPWAANTLVGALEHAALRDDCGAQIPTTLVVLAGGVERRAADAEDFSVLNAASRRRMDRAIAAWRAEPATQLWLSGGRPTRGRVPLARLMSAYARWQAVPASALHLEEASRTTWQSAQALRHLPLPRRIGLVSSTSHLGRAGLAFSVAGFRACVVPADPQRLDVRLPWSLLPRTSALEKTEAGLHELAGLVYYRWLRWRQGAT